MFQKVLIANRGEIAVRIIRTCRAMGLQTVAIYSLVDQNALHVLEADESVCIGEPEPHASYLNVDVILQAAKQTKAEAIHPGYGFLSENANFARACKKQGLVWIGPPAEVIEKLGDKLIARQLMQQHDVPVTPGTWLDADQKETWASKAEELGYPVLIKAAAGGGGKGMRIVHEPHELSKACKLAASEALSAFGDDRVYMEKYIANPRHIEFQIFADHTGNTLHLFERECSIQRRHQKIIEETPSPILDETLRMKMGEAAIKAAKAANYINAGTVEFLFNPGNQEYYFLEVNTRLQVEHPITEMLTGQDLVQWQIMVARGETLPLQQHQIPRYGHAFECRIYAEDPQNNFAPSPGTLSFYKAPQGPGIRHDGGVYSNAEVSTYYDPILSKIISFGHDRESARLKMIDALRQTVVLGIKTPIPMLIDILKHDSFIKGELSTHFIQEHMPDWSHDQDDESLACIAFILNDMLPQTHSTPLNMNADTTPSPWKTLGAWRLGET